MNGFAIKGTKENEKMREEWEKRERKCFFFIAKEQKIAFFWVPKCCSSSIINIIKLCNKGKLEYSDYENAKKNGYKFVAVIRNPYNRLISNTADHYKELLDKKEINHYDDLIEHFIINKKGNKYKNTLHIHNELQSSFIDTGEDKKEIDFTLLNFENKVKINSFLKSNGFKHTLENVHANENKNKFNKSMKKELKELLKTDKKLRDKIYKFYKKDFETFGYDKNII